MSVDSITVLEAVDDAVMAKRVRRTRDGFDVQSYDRGLWFRIEEHPVAGIVELGRVLAALERQPTKAIIRGRPLRGIDRERTRRLLYPRLDRNGEIVPETFEPAARRWLAVDIDGLPTPRWRPMDLARRQAAIIHDRAQHGRPTAKGPDDGEDIDPEGDGDPAPIDPARDWALVCRAAIGTLPVEFHDAHAWWQMTGSAGIKTGIRLRLWYWTNRPVTDAEAKRWLAEAPVDRSLFSPVQAHYIAAPLFTPPSADPVPLRSGMWWQHRAEVAVPELPEPPPAGREPVQRRTPTNAEERRAEGYAEAALEGVATAGEGSRHPTLMAVAVRLYSLANRGLLDPGDITARLLAAAARPLDAAERQKRCTRHGGRPSENEAALDWARARAKARPDLPEGF